MIRKLLFAFFALFTCGLIHAQQQVVPDQVRQVSVQNGVVIYESGGVEGFQTAEETAAPAVVVKPIAEWDLQQCDDALYFIEQKLPVVTESGDLESIAAYQQSKNEILARKAILTNQIQGQ